MCIYFRAFVEFLFVEFNANYKCFSFLREIIVGRFGCGNAHVHCCEPHGFQISILLYLVSRFRAPISGQNIYENTHC